MYIVTIHQIQSEAAFERGQKLIDNVGAPEGARGLEFYPSVDGRWVTCLWEAPSVEALKKYVDETLGDSSVNTVFQMDAEKGFAERPLGLSPPPARVG
jgi:hypothetical protein